MRSRQTLTLAALVAVVLLSGCATSAPPDPQAEAPYCQKTTRGRIVACTRATAPSLAADAAAKRFEADPAALSVYVVRRNWADAGHVVQVQADMGPSVETLPDTLVRFRLAPGRHVITWAFDGQRGATTVEGRAGEVRVIRLEGVVWSWTSSFAWVAEAEGATRERARRARLVADVPMGSLQRSLPTDAR